MLKFYCNILGEAYDQLISHPVNSRKKVIMMGSLLFIPVIVWAIVLFLFGHEFFSMTLAQSLILGTFGGLLIFCIERSIIISNGSWPITAFRILIGIIMTLLSSFMLDEFIFREDIRNQKIIELDLLYSQESKTENQLLAEVDNFNSQYIDKKTQAGQEAQGKGSGLRGVGEITNMLNVQANGFLQQKTNAENRLLELRDEKKKNYATEKAAILNGETDRQLLDNTRAMFAFLQNSKFAMGIFILFFILMAAMEFMVILFKLLSKETSYEKHLSTMEEIHKSKLEKFEARVKKSYDARKDMHTYKNAKQLVDENKQGLFNVNSRKTTRA